MKIRAIVLVILLVAAFTATAQQETPPDYFLGVDLSYVNEMEDCGAVYRVDGEPRDPYEIFHDAGANLVRLRLWHAPDWTDYSTLEDVTRSMERAKALGMAVLLDFHYSDTWADPGKQIIPAAWEDLDDAALGAALYEYTYDVLMQLDAQGLMPELVQVGNEINSEILRAEGTSGTPIDWERNAALINQGIRAVRDAGAAGSSAPRVMLHIAKPESVEGWLRTAVRAGVTDFDVIGISYYPGWSSHSIRTIDNIVKSLRERFEKDVMIVETSYPWTLRGANESAGNILGDDFLDPDYPATPEGQRQFMIDLTQAVLNGGGTGVIYWEPGWVSTPCETLWGTGSHWENATVFDFTNDNAVHAGIEWLGYPYTLPDEAP
ncbi:MAG: glycosyl hydrolase 53 family protein [Chloroflexi bacterium]|nr:glycosyl hydrolase 53 family protein [Chloroflexota bacterium]